MQLRVGDHVHELDKEDIGKNLPTVGTKHGETLLRILKMLHQFLSLHRERIFGSLLLVVERDNVLGDVA